MGYRESRDKLKTLSEKLLAPLIDFLGKRGVTPNMVTLLGLFINIIGAWFVATGSFVAGAAIILLASLLDMVDGTLARKLNKKSKFGGFLDSTTDRLSEGAAYLSLLVYYYLRGDSYGVILSYCVMFLSFMVSYIRARAGGLKIDCSAGIFTRPERMAVLILGLFINQVIPALWVIGALSLVTVIQRFTLVYKQAKYI
jgi:phosphatidylglycerophosphate synthase